MNISNYWFPFALLIAVFGAGYALGYYNSDKNIRLTDKVTPLSENGDLYYLQRGEDIYICSLTECFFAPNPEDATGIIQ